MFSLDFSITFFSHFFNGCKYRDWGYTFLLIYFNKVEKYIGDMGIWGYEGYIYRATYVNIEIDKLYLKSICKIFTEIT